MAHLPEEALPSDFDVVIEGTGKLHHPVLYQTLIYPLS